MNADSVLLLKNGKETFPSLLKDIEETKESLFINMFIWRNDSAGCEMAAALLRAADRGVRVEIVKDRYGVICETCEENEKSFFHRKTTLSEKCKAGFLRLIYNRDRHCRPSSVSEDGGMLFKALSEHPNVKITDGYRFDHSKFYLFDNRVLTFGGINVEDKERGTDYAGREYRDYMVRLEGKDIVDLFREIRKNPSLSSTTPFGLNVKEPVLFFGMKERYLRLIRQAEKELTVIMAYWSPLPEFTEAVVSAVKRGVKVRILCPEQANFQNDLNRKTLTLLSRKCGGKLSVYLSPCMVHTKLLMSEKELSFGSCNITRKAFGQLDELNLFLDASDSLYETVKECINADFAEAGEPVSGVFPYHRLWAAAEGLLM